MRERLGYDPFFAWAPDTVYTDIERDGGAFRATVQWIDAENRQRGERAIVVQGTDCTPVIDAVGLTVSLTLDPSSLVGDRPSAAPTPVPVPPPDAVTPAPTAVPSRKPPVALAGPARTEDALAPRSSGHGEEVALRVGVGVVGAVDSAPSPTMGATVSLGARWQRLSLELEWRADFPATGRGLVPPVEVRSWLVVGAVVPCVHVAFASACPVFAAGAMGATATHVVHSTEAYGPWAALGGRLGVAWEIAPRLTLGAFVESLATLVRDDLAVDATVQYRVGPLSSDLGATASWRFR